MSNNNDNSFLDKNTILAIALSIIFFIGWQFYIQRAYPPKENQQIKQEPQSLAETKQGPVSGENLNKEKAQTQVKPTTQPTTKKNQPEEKLAYFSGKNIVFAVSTQGMGVKNITLNEYSDRDEEKIQFGKSLKDKLNLATHFKDQPLYFEIEQKNENTFVGVGRTNEVAITKTMVVNDSQYTIQVDVQVQWFGNQRTEPIETSLGNEVIRQENSLFMPAYEGTEFFFIAEGEEERERIDIEAQMTGQYKNVSLASIGSQYFTLAIINTSSMAPNGTVFYDPKSFLARTSILHQSIDGKENFKYSFLTFLGPKNYDLLTAVDPLLAQSIDYGIFSVLSKPILSMLKWLYSVFQNWGISIILLTVFIRILLLPINISSYKSMKRMQAIQPQLKKIKEKFKDDPQKVNQETMALMKKEKANPIGGCLPMLLQLPVFFALYSVLGQSIELYKSPFIFWIQDLSFKDPYFVLPIGVAALYFIQQKLTPTAMDPAQAKVMQWIPVVFGFFMLSIPSGLTLYFFINTVFGIGQQFLLHKDKRKAAA